MGGWGFEPGEVGGVLAAPGDDFKDGGGDVDAGDFGGVEFIHAVLKSVGPEAECAAGLGAPGAAGALGGGGQADVGEFELVEAACG